MNQFEAFGRKLFVKIIEEVSLGHSDEWTEAAMEMAEQCGLVWQEDFDPKKHAEIAEPGDKIWTWSKPALEMKFIDPATREEQPDLSKRGVLVREEMRALSPQEIEAMHQKNREAMLNAPPIQRDAAANFTPEN